MTPMHEDRLLSELTYKGLMVILAIGMIFLLAVGLVSMIQAERLNHGPSDEPREWEEVECTVADLVEAMNMGDEYPCDMEFQNTVVIDHGTGG